MNLNEIQDLINFLNKAGSKIIRLSKRTIKIIGVKKINEINYSVMFDRIEAGTYLIAAALTEGKIRIKNVDPKIVKPLFIHFNRCIIVIVYNRFYF